ncbi:MAG: four helix bundle protein [Polyangiales bacterium]
MSLDHERFDVYQLALGFHAFAIEVSARVPRGYGETADQLRRAAQSIFLNISEGAGKFSRADKRRYYLSARGSVNECGGLLDALQQLSVIDESSHRARKHELVRMHQMLIRLAQRMEKR